jgi:hypothetical protein
MPTPRITAALVLAALVAVSMTAQAPRPTGLEFHERFVAIDYACAWPNLTLLPDGKIAAVIWPRPSHGMTEGAAECWISDDLGTSWRLAGVPVPNVPGTNRMNVAAGQVDGKIITLVGGWNGRQPFKDKNLKVSGTHDGSVTLEPIPAVSEDGGTTWTRYPDQDFPIRDDGKSLVPFGPVARLATGEIAVALYGSGVFFYVSTTDGATWSLRGTMVQAGTHNETAWVELDNGELFAASRTFGDQRVDGLRSKDGGRTWTNEGPLTLARQHPADLFKLPDGRVLLTYASRNSGMYGVWVQMGDPEAKAWSAPTLIVDLEGSTQLQHTPTPGSDGGYPATVLTSDGTFVTAYYTRGVPAHQRYHMGVVRWKPGKSTFQILTGPPK